MNIVFLGAGAIGCCTGAHWASKISATNSNVLLIGRESTVGALRRQALICTGRPLATAQVSVTTDPSALATADVIVLTMKTQALPSAMNQIADYAQADTPVISLLNGLASVRQLRGRFPGRSIIAGMVPFNAVWTAADTIHITGPGEIAVGKSSITAHMQQLGIELDIQQDMEAVQYGKLLLNLLNAVNAVSGIPLYEMLSDRGYRRVYAASVAEALRVYDRAAINWQQVGTTSPKIALPILRAPNWLFHHVVLKKQQLDRHSMTSMATDLSAGKPTEIDFINGEIVDLGLQCNIATPVNSALVQLVKSIESGTTAGQLSSTALLQAVGM